MEADKTLICRQCGNEFMFTQEQQAFYAEKGFVNAPKRCDACTMARRAIEVPEKPKKEMFDAICADCGAQTQLPFRPKGDRPVYCSACLLKHKKENAKQLSHE